MRALIPLACVAVIAVAVVVAYWINSRVKGARQDRRELACHQAFLRKLHSTALATASIDPASAVLADEIGNHLATTLKESR